MNETVNCPVCEEADCSKALWPGKAEPLAFEYRYDCRRCGVFVLSDSVKHVHLCIS